MSNITLNKSFSDPNKSLLKRPLFQFLVVFFLIIKVLLALLWPAQQVPLASDLSSENILSAVNKERSLRNLVTLNTNSKLSFAAQSKAEDMQNRHYFAHVDPDGHYIWDKIVAAGYTPYLQLGENLAIEFYDTDSLMSAWMNSPTHRANILQEGFKDQGMGLVFGDTQNGQYHSAIANTFGAQDTSVKSKPKVATAQPTAQTTSVPTPTPKETQTSGQNKPTEAVKTNATTSAPAKTATSSEQTATASPQTTKPVVAVEPRQAEPASDQKNFTLPHKQIETQPKASTSPLRESEQTNPDAVTGQNPANEVNPFNVNRYLTLICAVALLLLMLSDLKKAVESKLTGLDKKINNLVLLLISILTIALIYWL